MVAYVFVPITIATVLAVVCILIYRKYRIIRLKYSPILDLDAELNKVKIELNLLQVNRDNFKAENENQRVKS